MKDKIKDLIIQTVQCRQCGCGQTYIIAKQPSNFKCISCGYMEYQVKEWVKGYKAIRDIDNG